MKTYFSGESANDVWRQAASEVFREKQVLQDSRLGKSLELIHASFSIRDPRQRWVYSRMPAINPAFAIAEVVWILSGQNDANFINFWNPALPKFSGNSHFYHGAYGFRLRSHFGIDQMTRAYEVLSANPNSRQVVLQIWDPAVDLPQPDGSPVGEDVPCNICSILKVRDGKLEWLQVMRSNDLYRGTPYNIIQFTTLQEIIAGWLNLSMGEYYQISDSLHFYESDLSGIYIDSSTKGVQFCPNPDDLRLTKDEFDLIFPLVLKSMQQLCSPNLTIPEFCEICDTTDIPPAYKNLVVIAAADSARRRAWPDKVDMAINACSNSHLIFLWDRWADRHSRQLRYS